MTLADEPVLQVDAARRCLFVGCPPEAASAAAASTLELLPLTTLSWSFNMPPLAIQPPSLNLQFGSPTTAWLPMTALPLSVRAAGS